jgi:hypothetical protein
LLVARKNRAAALVCSRVEIVRRPFAELLLRGVDSTPGSQAPPMPAFDRNMEGSTNEGVEIFEINLFMSF